MSFYDNYIALCNKAGKSPSAAAVEMGLTKPSVNRWKTGSQPTDATLRRVADYFGVPLTDLKGTLSLEDVVYLTAKENGFDGAAELLKEQKKPTDQSVSGLKETGYELLTPENRQMIDSLIASLLISQSGE